MTLITGGTVTDVAGFRIHRFDANDTVHVLVAGQVRRVLVGGGAGASTNRGGGGGGGDVVDDFVDVAVGDYPVVVGAGGPAAAGSSLPGSNGGDTSLFGRTAKGGGGGGGGGSPSTGAGNPGGSGGGGGTRSGVAGAGGAATGSGHAGGTGQGVAPFGGGGGGGAGAPGANGSATGGGKGGDGIQSDISGVPTYYGGGGGGGENGTNGTPGAGGLGGGGTGGSGSGSKAPQFPTAGTDGTGGGAGGGGADTSASSFKPGGRGVAYVSYPLTSIQTPTLTVSAIGPASAQLTGSAYSDSDGTPQGSAQWQVTTANDPTFLAPIVNTGADAVHLLAFLATGLTASTDYLARVRYSDSGGLASSWSATVAFSTISRWVADDVPAGDAWNPDDLAPQLAVPVSVPIGLGPAATLPAGDGISHANVAGVFSGVTVTMEQVTHYGANSLVAGLPDSFQRDPGTGVPSLQPLRIRFNPPIRGFQISVNQAEFPTPPTFVRAWNGTSPDGSPEHFLLDVPFVGPYDKSTMTASFDWGSNFVDLVELHPNAADWVVWFAMVLLIGEAGGAWSPDDSAPATGWATDT